MRVFELFEETNTLNIIKELDIKPLRQTLYHFTSVDTEFEKFKKVARGYTYLSKNPRDAYRGAAGASAETIFDMPMARNTGSKPRFLTVEPVGDLYIYGYGLPKSRRMEVEEYERLERRIKETYTGTTRYLAMKLLSVWQPMSLRPMEVDVEYVTGRGKKFERRKSKTVDLQGFMEHLAKQYGPYNDNILSYEEIDALQQSLIHRSEIPQAISKLDDDDRTSFHKFHNTPYDDFYVSPERLQSLWHSGYEGIEDHQSGKYVSALTELGFDGLIVSDEGGKSIAVHNVDKLKITKSTPHGTWIDVDDYDEGDIIKEFSSFGE